jgi:hypothetical protein
MYPKTIHFAIQCGHLDYQEYLMSKHFDLQTSAGNNLSYATRGSFFRRFVFISFHLLRVLV